MAGEPIVTTDSITNIKHDSAVGNGTVVSINSGNPTYVGIEPCAINVLTSQELPLLVVDGLSLQSGFIYCAGRYNSQADSLAKVSTGNYSYITKSSFYAGGDNLQIISSCLWVADGNGNMFQFSAIDLSYSSGVNLSAAYGITQSCEDGSGNIFFGTNNGGAVIKFKLSDFSKVQGAVMMPSTDYYVHTMCIDQGNIYGHINSIAGNSAKVFKYDIATLSSFSLAATVKHGQCIVQDTNYFYLLSETIPDNAGIFRFSKSDLSETQLVTIDAQPGDGLISVSGYLIAGWSQDSDFDMARVWVAKESEFVNHNRVALIAGNNRAINGLVDDGDYIHVMQINGAGTVGVYFNKFNKSDILTTLTAVRESGVAFTSSFSEIVTGLYPLTQYCIVAYAQNTDGYGYGSTVFFTTSQYEDIQHIGLGMVCE